MQVRPGSKMAHATSIRLRSTSKYDYHSYAITAILAWASTRPTLPKLFWPVRRLKCTSSAGAARPVTKYLRTAGRALRTACQIAPT